MKIVLQEEEKKKRNFPLNRIRTNLIEFLNIR